MKMIGMWVTDEEYSFIEETRVRLGFRGMAATVRSLAGLPKRPETRVPAFDRGRVQSFPTAPITAEVEDARRELADAEQVYLKYRIPLQQGKVFPNETLYLYNTAQKLLVKARRINRITGELFSSTPSEPLDKPVKLKQDAKHAKEA
jgi:hypothetical protein